MRYLTRRQSGFRFQIRIPCDLEGIYGKTPIRIALGPIPTMKARSLSRLLAGRAEQIFSSIRLSGTMNSPDTKQSDERDQIIEKLQEMLLEALSDAEVLQAQTEEKHKIELQTLKLRMTTAEYVRQKAMTERLKVLGEKLVSVENTVRNTVSRAKERSKQQTDQKSVTDLAAEIQEMKSLLAQTLSGGPPKPLLSEVLDRWRKAKLKQGVAAKNVNGQINRIKNFIDYCGNRPLNTYKFLDFQEYANLLVHVPANWHRRPEMRDGTLREAAEYNDGLPPKRKHETFTETTISEKYLSPLKSIFRDMAGQHDFPNPFVGVAVRISTEARESVERQPLSTDELNIWFRSAAREKRPDLKWLPLLATLTGARLAELVFLQGKDIIEVTPGRWAADLTTPLENEDGEEEDRKTKNRGSKRLFALHSALIEAGFMRYVATRRDEEWLFPHAHGVGKESVEHPADAASKRLNRRLKQLGLHKPYEVTFHSTRHSAKDIFRDGKIPEHTHDMQTGHVTKTVARGYGAKKLRDMDVDLLAALPLPEGLDLSPYLENNHRR